MYIATLAVMPCADNYVDGEIHHEATHNSAEDDFDTDCSPLCACQCCHIYAFISIPFISLQSAINYLSFDYFLIEDKPAATQNELFRPPQHIS
jgi:hypothetical protein